jgi:hypothetical protein
MKFLTDLKVPFENTCRKRHQNDETAAENIRKFQNNTRNGIFLQNRVYIFIIRKNGLPVLRALKRRSRERR